MSSVGSQSSFVGVRNADGRAEVHYDLLPVVARVFKITGIGIVAWSWGYMGFSIAWIYIGLCFYVVSSECRKIKAAKKEYARQAVDNEKDAVLSRMDDHPSWVYFPDVEKAEWFNKVIKQMWPFICEYVSDLLKSKIEKSIQSCLPKNFNNFTFETIDLGDTPVRLDGIRVYSDEKEKDEIVLDVDLRYVGDAKIKVSLDKFVAGVKSLSVCGTMRVIVKPLVDEIPIIGGLSIFFLNRPSINFDLTEAANTLDFPLFKKSLRSIVEEAVARTLVLPNRIPVQLADGVDISKLKYPIPQGVIQLHIVEARDLKKADKNVFTQDTSDPYCKITVGAVVLQTKVLKKTVNPKWDERFEVIVDQKYGQCIEIEIKDEDRTGKDDSIGLTGFDVETIAKAHGGTIELWQQLENVTTGSIHIRAKWLRLCKDLEEMKRTRDIASRVTSRTGRCLSCAVVIVYLEEASDLPIGQTSKEKRNAFAVVKVGMPGAASLQTEKSTIQPRNSNPKWNENFHFLVDDPERQSVTIELLHHGQTGDKKLGQVLVPISELFTADDLTSQMRLPMADVGPKCTISFRLTLRIMKSEQLFDWFGEGNFDAKPTSAVEKSLSANTPTLTSQLSESLGTTAGNVKQTPPLSHSSSVSSADLIFRNSRLSQSNSERTVGQIQLTINHSASHGKLSVTVNQCRGLIPHDRDHAVDSYVRVCFQSNTATASKHKTKVFKNSVAPVFDETFQYQVSRDDLPSLELDVAVKNDINKIFSSKGRADLGHVVIRMSEIGNATTAWYDLKESGSH